MPIIKSAIKRVRQQETRRKRNLVIINKYKDLIKEFKELVSNGKKEEAIKLFPLVQKAIDMAAKKNLLHKNNTGRKKSQLAKMIAGETAPKKTATKKAPTKKVEKK